MRLINFLILLIIVGTSFSVSYTLSISQTNVYGEPNTQKEIVASVQNTGLGGLLIYSSTSTGSPPLSSCIAPGTTAQVSIPITVAAGQNTQTIQFTMMDFWDVINGNTCNQHSQNSYDVAHSAAYSQTVGQTTIVTYGGCQFGYPTCDDSHLCQSNACILKLGCQYSNPACDASHNCQDNQCILKPGCQYSNPPCQEGYICENNQCDAVITSQDQQRIFGKLTGIDTRFNNLDSKINDLRSIYQQLGNTAKLQYLDSLQSFVSNSRLKVANIRNSLTIGQKKTDVYPQIAQTLNSIEQNRASLLGQNPQQTALDLTKFPPPADISPSVIIPTPTPSQPISPGNTLPQPPAVIPTPTSRVSLALVQNLVASFPELNQIDNGRSITLIIMGDDLKSHFFYIGKLNGAMDVREANLNTDIALSMNEADFLALFNSQNKCSLLKSLSESSVSATPLADQTTLMGFCKLKNCISPNAVPAISACLW